MNREVIPAVMPQTVEEMTSAVLLVRHTVDTVQIDIMDGNYVVPQSWPFVYARDLREIQDDEFAFPLWEEMNYELDLMVRTPEQELPLWLSLGASRIIFHFASVHEWEKIFAIDHVIKRFTHIGVAVTVHDNLEEVFGILDSGSFDFVQVMGISHVGYQGEPFAKESLEVIRSLRDRYPELPISVDGGVNSTTVNALYHAGANRFVAGSAVYKNGIPSENVEMLYDTLDSSK